MTPIDGSRDELEAQLVRNFFMPASNKQRQEYEKLSGTLEPRGRLTLVLKSSQAIKEQACTAPHI